MLFTGEMWRAWKRRGVSSCLCLLLVSGAIKEGSLGPWKTPSARASGDGRREPYSLSHAGEELFLGSTYSSCVTAPALLALAGKTAQAQGYRP